MSFPILTLLALGSLLSIPVNADGNILNWSDLPYETEMLLAQDLEWPEGEALLRGARVRYLTDTDLGTVPVRLYELELLDCPGPEVIWEMELFLPDNAPAGRDRRVGVILRGECVLEIFVESHDVFTPSLFLSLS